MFSKQVLHKQLHSLGSVEERASISPGCRHVSQTQAETTKWTRTLWFKKLSSRMQRCSVSKAEVGAREGNQGKAHKGFPWVYMAVTFSPWPRRVSIGTATDCTRRRACWRKTRNARKDAFGAISECCGNSNLLTVFTDWERARNLGLVSLKHGEGLRRQVHTSRRKLLGMLWGRSPFQTCLCVPGAYPQPSYQNKQTKMLAGRILCKNLIGQMRKLRIPDRIKAEV